MGIGGEAITLVEEVLATGGVKAFQVFAHSGSGSMDAPSMVMMTATSPGYGGCCRS